MWPIWEGRKVNMWLDSNTKVIVQGILRPVAQYHAEQMLAQGTQIVGGVSPRSGRTQILGIPVFDNMFEAVRVTHANVSIIFTPHYVAADAILEAADAGIKTIVCITENVPIMDMVRVQSVLERKKVKLIGPNFTKIIRPEG